MADKWDIFEDETDPSEQWLLQGYCEDCRRREYCKRPCTAKKRRVNGMIQGAIRQSTGADKLLGVMNYRGE